MSSDSIHAISEVKSRVRDLRQRTARSLACRDQLVEGMAAKTHEVADLSDRIEKLSKVAELFRVLMDLMVDKQVRSVEAMVSHGFRSIFHDLELSLESEVGPRNNRVAVDFYIRQGGKDNPLAHRGRPLEAFGGGPSSVAALILKVLTVTKLKLWPFLALDETLSAVSDEYVEATAMFLSSLAGKMGMDILLVTHKNAFLEHTDRSYRCTEVLEGDGTRHLSLRSLK